MAATPPPAVAAPALPALPELPGPDLPPRRRSRPGGKRPQRPPSGPAMPALDEIPHAGGKLLDADPFNDTFGGGGASQALELDAPTPARRRKATEPRATRKRRASPEQQRANEIEALAGYGPRPKKLWQCVPYGVRVAMRKSAMRQELSALTQQRERLDAQLEDALCALGELFFGLRGDPSVARLGPQLDSVARAQSSLGDAEVAGQQARNYATRELETVNQQLHALEQEAAPIRQRRGQYRGALKDAATRVRHAEAGAKKAEAELEALKRDKHGIDPERYAALVARIREHEERRDELQAELPELEQSLRTLDMEVARLDALIEGLKEQRKSQGEALERARDEHRESMGSAKSARREALRLLAEAGLSSGLGTLAEAKATAVRQARERAEKKLVEEQAQREAMESYDPVAYRRGIGFVVVVVGVVFVGMAGKILF